MKNNLNYFTMSDEDRDFTTTWFDSSKTFGLKLPVRNNYIKPISIGIFSALYEDGRKNENWILEYCKNQALSKAINFVFIGLVFYFKARKTRYLFWMVLVSMKCRLNMFSTK